MINLRSSLFALALALSAAACQKAPDLGKMQTQALLTVNSYTGELEVLQRRADTLLATLRNIDPNLPGANEAGRRLGEARGLLEQLRALTLGAPGAFTAAAKGGSRDELAASIDNTTNRLQDGTTTIVGDLTAVDNWTAFAQPVAQHTPPAAPPPGTEPATTETEGAPTPTPPAAPDATKPDVTKPDAAKPDAAKPDAAKPDAAKPDAAKPATPPAAKPDAAKPATPAAKPDAAKPATKPAAPAATPAK